MSQDKTTDYDPKRVPYYFTSKEFDKETGLYYYGARYYDPKTSVWQSPDPIIDAYLDFEGNGGVLNSLNVNLFSYSYQNPIKLIDPDGKKPAEPGSGKKPWYEHRLAKKASKWLKNQFLILIGIKDSPKQYIIGKDGKKQPVAIMQFPDILGGKGAGKQIFKKALPACKKALPAILRNFDDIVKNPRSLWGKSAKEVKEILGEGWTQAKYGKTGTGWKFTKGDKSIFYHEGGRHVGPYYGYSSGKTGKVKIIGPGYKPLPGDKAKIIKLKE